EPLGQYLSPYYKIYIPDLPGFGLSNNNIQNNLTIEELADSIAGWLETAGLVNNNNNNNNIKSPYFIGNSMGCQIITELSIRYPSYVRKCILQGPTKGSNNEYLPTQIMKLLWNGRGERFGMPL